MEPNDVSEQFWQGTYPYGVRWGALVTPLEMEFKDGIDADLLFDAIKVLSPSLPFTD